MEISNGRGGARLYKFFHGGEVHQNSLNGEWYVSKRMGDSSIGSSSKSWDGVNNLPTADITEKIRYNWTGRSTRNAGKTYWNQESLAKELYYHPITRRIIPDFIQFNVNFSASSIAYVETELTLSIMFRGSNPGIYGHAVIGGGASTSVDIEVGADLERGAYLGDARNLTPSVLEGVSTKGYYGIGVKAGIGGDLHLVGSIGENAEGEAKTSTFGIGINSGLGLTTPGIVAGGGRAKSTTLIPFLTADGVRELFD